MRSRHSIPKTPKSSLFAAPQKKSSAPCLIFINGPAGSGKSTLARDLASQLNWVLIDRDQVKSHLLAEGIGLEVSTDVADRLMLKQAARHIGQNPVILDCGGHRASLLAKVQQFAAAVDVPLKTILCLAPRATRDRRMAARQPLVSQLPCTTSTFDVPESAYRYLPPGRLLLNMARPLAETVTQATHFLLTHALPPRLADARLQHTTTSADQTHLEAA